MYMHIKKTETDKDTESEKKEQSDRKVVSTIKGKSSGGQYFQYLKVSIHTCFHHCSTSIIILNSCTGAKLKQLFCGVLTVETYSNM